MAMTLGNHQTCRLVDASREPPGFQQSHRWRLSLGWDPPVLQMARVPIIQRQTSEPGPCPMPTRAASNVGALDLFLDVHITTPPFPPLLLLIHSHHLNILTMLPSC